jgi:hypothetical protein
MGKGNVLERKRGGDRMTRVMRKTVRNVWMGAQWAAIVLFVVMGCGTMDDADGEEGRRGDEREMSALAVFSEERAWRYAEEYVGLGAKPAGGDGSGTAAAAEWIRRQLEAAGVAAEVREFRDAAPGGEGMFRNVVGRIAAREGGIGEGRMVLLGAHYDTKTGINGFVGANDSGSGTGLLLELARSLAAAPAELEVRVAFFDGEEAAVKYGPADGFHGSRRLAAEMEETGELGRVAGMILLDMVGDRVLGLTLPLNGSPELTRLAFESARELGVREKFRLAKFAIGDDHVAFAEKGVPTVDLIDFEYGGGPGRNEFWHTAEDTLDKMSAESLGTVGRVTLRMVEKLGG